MQIGAEMGLSGSAEGVSFSVDSGFSRVSGHETEVKVAEVCARASHSKTYLTKGSSELYSFSLRSDFLRDFQSLPIVVTDAHIDHAWSPFAEFMCKWGSHVVQAAYTGAVYQSWSSSQADRRHSKYDMTLKACVKAEGLKAEAALSV